MIPRYPLQWPAGWPRATSRKRAAFTKYKNQLSVMDGISRATRELAAMGARRDDIVISTNIETRLDGLPRSDRAEPKDPGVAVYWVDKTGHTKVMAIDRYDRTADNLAAIAATLEAMRAIERHGGGQILERAFTGFDALPPPKSCWDVLGIPRGSSREQIEKAFRDLAKRHHPDVGGNVVEFHAIQNARDEALRA